MVQIIGLLEILNIISVYIIITFVVLNNCIFTVFFLLLEVDILKNAILTGWQLSLLKSLRTVLILHLIK